MHGRPKAAVWRGSLTLKTLQVYRGHVGPVATIEFFTPPSSDPSSPSSTYLITGSWDKKIKIWNTSTKEAVSSTLAHDDFVKKLLVIPQLNLLISGGSDKLIKLWDLSSLPPNAKDVPSDFTLSQVGSMSDHTRPVEVLAVDTSSPLLRSQPFLLYTGDSMGLIKVWSLEPPPADGRSGWRATLKGTLGGHRTGICDMVVDQGIVWSASYDATVLLQTYPPSPQFTPAPCIPHPFQCRTMLALHLPPHSLPKPILLTGCADTIKLWDVTSFGEPDGEYGLLATIDDGHWHDVTVLDVWLRDKKDQEGKATKGKEIWIVSASLDGTVRRWKLDDILANKVTKVSEKDLGPAIDLPINKELEDLDRFMDELQAQMAAEGDGPQDLSALIPGTRPT